MYHHQSQLEYNATPAMVYVLCREFSTCGRAPTRPGLALGLHLPFRVGDGGRGTATIRRERMGAVEGLNLRNRGRAGGLRRGCRHTQQLPHHLPLVREHDYGSVIDRGLVPADFIRGLDGGRSSEERRV